LLRVTGYKITKGPFRETFEKKNKSTKKGRKRQIIF
jgi:hypothetical protein